MRKDFLQGSLRGGTTRPEEVTYKQSRALMAAGHILEAWSLCARESTELCTVFWKRAPLRLLRAQRASVREQPRLTPAVPPRAAKPPSSVLTRDANSFHFEKGYLRLAPQKFKQELTAVWDAQLEGQCAPQALAVAGEGPRP